MFKKIIHIVVITTFLFNNVAFGLGPGLISSELGQQTRPGGQETVSALALEQLGKLFELHGGKIKFDGALEDAVERVFTGETPVVESLRFVDVDPSNPPAGVVANPINDIDAKVLFEYLEKNDVWFEYESVGDKTRRISVANEIFKWIYQMSSGKAAVTPTYNAIQMWFLGSYLYGDSKRYNNYALKKHLQSLFPGQTEEIDLALVINHAFFFRPGIVVPDIDIRAYTGRIDPKELKIKTIPSDGKVGTMTWNPNGPTSARAVAERMFTSGKSAFAGGAGQVFSREQHHELLNTILYALLDHLDFSAIDSATLDTKIAGEIRGRLELPIRRLDELFARNGGRTPIASIRGDQSDARSFDLFLKDKDDPSIRLHAPNIFRIPNPQRDKEERPYTRYVIEVRRHDKETTKPDIFGTDKRSLREQIKFVTVINYLTQEGKHNLFTKYLGFVDIQYYNVLREVRRQYLKEVGKNFNDQIILDEANDFNKFCGYLEEALKHQPDITQDARMVILRLQEKIESFVDINDLMIELLTLALDNGTVSRETAKILLYLQQLGVGVVSEEIARDIKTNTHYVGLGGDTWFGIQFNPMRAKRGGLFRPGTIGRAVETILSRSYRQDFLPLQRSLIIEETPHKRFDELANPYPHQPGSVNAVFDRLQPQNANLEDLEFRLKILRTNTPQGEASRYCDFINPPFAGHTVDQLHYQGFLLITSLERALNQSGALKPLCRDDNGVDSSVDISVVDDKFFDDKAQFPLRSTFVVEGRDPFSVAGAVINMLKHANVNNTLEITRDSKFTYNLLLTDDGSNYRVYVMIKNIVLDPFDYTATSTKEPDIVVFTNEPKWRDEVESLRKEMKDLWNKAGEYQPELAVAWEEMKQKGVNNRDIEEALESRFPGKLLKKRYNELIKKGIAAKIILYQGRPAGVEMSDLVIYGAPGLKDVFDKVMANTQLQRHVIDSIFSQCYYPDFELLTAKVSDALGKDLVRAGDELAVSTEKMAEMASTAVEHMNAGLEGKESSLAMLPAFVAQPTGSEEGEFFAIDVGGSKLRVLEVDLKGNGVIPDIDKIKEADFKDEHKTGTAEVLFDFIADNIGAFIKDNKLDGSKEMSLGLTWSFPVEQKAIDSGKAIALTKGWTTSGVVGNDPIELLRQALKRKGLDNVKVVALCNDTVGTLATARYKDRDCMSGIILGTGTNAAISLPVKSISKFTEPIALGEMMVNLEWGNFDQVPLTEWDRTLDGMTNNIGEHLLEKMVSGKYIGELARLIINDMIKNDYLFDGRTLEVFGRTPDSNEIGEKSQDPAKKVFLAEYISRIEEDKTRDLSDVGALLAELGISDTSMEDRVAVKRICEMVSTRSARIAAAAMMALILKMDPELRRSKIVLAIDGSLFTEHPFYKERLMAAFKELMPEDYQRISLVEVKDGSGTGAAIIAAMAVAAKRAGDGTDFDNLIQGGTRVNTRRVSKLLAIGDSQSYTTIIDWLRNGFNDDGIIKNEHEAELAREICEGINSNRVSIEDRQAFLRSEEWKWLKKQHKNICEALIKKYGLNIFDVIYRNNGSFQAVRNLETGELLNGLGRLNNYGGSWQTATHLAVRDSNLRLTVYDLFTEKPVKGLIAKDAAGGYDLTLDHVMVQPIDNSEPVYYDFKGKELTARSARGAATTEELIADVQLAVFITEIARAKAEGLLLKDGDSFTTKEYMEAFYMQDVKGAEENLKFLVEAGFLMRFMTAEGDCYQLTEAAKSWLEERKRKLGAKFGPADRVGRDGDVQGGSISFEELAERLRKNEMSIWSLAEAVIMTQQDYTIAVEAIKTLPDAETLLAEFEKLLDEDGFKRPSPAEGARASIAKSLIDSAIEMLNSYDRAIPQDGSSLLFPGKPMTDFPPSSTQARDCIDKGNIEEAALRIEQMILTITIRPDSSRDVTKTAIEALRRAVRFLDEADEIPGHDGYNRPAAAESLAATGDKQQQLGMNFPEEISASNVPEQSLAATGDGQRLGMKFPEEISRANEPVDVDKIPAILKAGDNDRAGRKEIIDWLLNSFDADGKILNDHAAEQVEEICAEINSAFIGYRKIFFQSAEWNALKKRRLFNKRNLVVYNQLVTIYELDIFEKIYKSMDNFTTHSLETGEPTSKTPFYPGIAKGGTRVEPEMVGELLAQGNSQAYTKIIGWFALLCNFDTTYGKIEGEHDTELAKDICANINKAPIAERRAFFLSKEWDELKNWYTLYDDLVTTYGLVEKISTENRQWSTQHILTAIEKIYTMEGLQVAEAWIMESPIDNKLVKKAISDLTDAFKYSVDEIRIELTNLNPTPGWIRSSEKDKVLAAVLKRSVILADLMAAQNRPEVVESVSVAALTEEVIAAIQSDPSLHDWAKEKAAIMWEKFIKTFAATENAKINIADVKKALIAKTENNENNAGRINRASFVLVVGGITGLLFSAITGIRPIGVAASVAFGAGMILKTSLSGSVTKRIFSRMPQYLDLAEKRLAGQTVAAPAAFVLNKVAEERLEESESAVAVEAPNVPKQIANEPADVDRVPAILEEGDRAGRMEIIGWLRNSFDADGKILNNHAKEQVEEICSDINVAYLDYRKAFFQSAEWKAFKRRKLRSKRDLTIYKQLVTIYELDRFNEIVGSGNSITIHSLETGKPVEGLVDLDGNQGFKRTTTHLAVRNSEKHVTVYILETGKPAKGFVNLDASNGFELTLTHLTVRNRRNSCSTYDLATRECVSRTAPETDDPNLDIIKGGTPVDVDRIPAILAKGDVVGRMEIIGWLLSSFNADGKIMSDHAAGQVRSICGAINRTSLAQSVRNMGNPFFSSAEWQGVKKEKAAIYNALITTYGLDRFQSRYPAGNYLSIYDLELDGWSDSLCWLWVLDGYKRTTTHLAVRDAGRLTVYNLETGEVIDGLKDLDAKVGFALTLTGLWTIDSREFSNWYDLKTGKSIDKKAFDLLDAAQSASAVDATQAKAEGAVAGVDAVLSIDAVQERIVTLVGQMIRQYNQKTPVSFDEKKVMQRALADANLDEAIALLWADTRLSQEEKGALKELLKTTYDLALPYFDTPPAMKSNPIYHHTQVLVNMMRIGLGEKFTFDELRTALLAALLHDIGNAVSKQEKVKSSQIKDAVKDGRIQGDGGALDLARKAVAFRQEHMDNAPELIGQVLAQLPGNLEIDAAGVQLIKDAAAVHDNPSIDNDLNALGENRKDVAEYPAGHFLFRFDGSPLGRMIEVLREADRLFMVSYQGVVKDITDKKKEDVNAVIINAKLLSNMDNHRGEYLKSYKGTDKDDEKFIESSLYRTSSGFDIFDNAPGVISNIVEREEARGFGIARGAAADEEPGRPGGSVTIDQLIDALTRENPMSIEEVAIAVIGGQQDCDIAACAVMRVFGLKGVGELLSIVNNDLCYLTDLVQAVADRTKECQTASGEVMAKSGFGAVTIFLALVREFPRAATAPAQDGPEAEGAAAENVSTAEGRKGVSGMKKYARGLNAALAAKREEMSDGTSQEKVTDLLPEEELKIVRKLIELIGLGTGPEAENLEKPILAIDSKTLENLYKTVGLLSPKNKIEVLHHQTSLNMTEPVRATISRFNRKRDESEDSVKCTPFLFKEGLLEQLPEAGVDDGVKRVIVVSDVESEKAVNEILKECPERLKNVRIFKVELPYNYDKMQTNDRSVCQMDVIVRALLVRMLEKDGNLFVRATLKVMLERGRVMLAEGRSKGNIDMYIDGLIDAENETPEGARNRILGNLGYIVSLAEKIYEQIIILRDFVWCAA